MNRREFLAGGLTTAAAAAIGATDPLKAPKVPTDKLIWATKYQLGTHDQCPHMKDPFDPDGHFLGRTYPTVDMEAFWQKIRVAKECGVNMIMVNVLESLAYPSHPELGLKGSWSAERMHDVMKKIRDDYGMETIPALNFSTGHGLWLGWYSRMVSTPTYYRVVADILKDVYDVFAHPRLINFGMDEESPDVSGREYNLYRLKRLYWHDVRFYVDTIEKLGARAWCDADKEWWGTKEYCENMPKSVLQSNWYYGSTCDVAEIHRLAEKAKTKNPNLERLTLCYLQSFDRLEAAGYDQVPVGSCYYDRLDRHSGNDRSVCEESFPRMVRYCTEKIDPTRLKGFFISHWMGPNAKVGQYEKYCRILARAKKVYGEM